MTDRLLIEGYDVSPRAFVLDADGNLTRLPVQPVFVPKTEWPSVVDNMDTAEAQLRQQVEGAPLAVVEDEAVAE